MKENERIVWITGGTRGLGLALTERFIKEGCRVITNYAKDAAAAEKLCERLPAEVFRADVRDIQALQKIAAYIETRYGRLDILVNNAGIGRTGRHENVSPERFREVMDINVNGKYNCVQTALPLLKKSSRACVVNVSSAAGVNASGAMSAYCTAAAGIIMLTRCAAKDLSEWKIRVNCISPSMMEGGMSRIAFSDADREYVREHNPMKRLGSFEESVNCIIWLCSENSSYINGENIMITGGQ